MKKVEYMGITYPCPEWVNWVAADSDGEVYGYEFKPIDGIGIYIEKEDTRFAHIGCMDHNYKVEKV